MSKTIRLEIPTYDRLLQFRGKRETISEAVERLLDIRDGIVDLTSTIKGAQDFAEYHIKKLAEIAPTLDARD